MDTYKEFSAYNDHEEHHWWFKSRRKIFKIFLKKVLNQHSKSVLEVGCGTGGNLKFLFKDFQKISAIEQDQNAISFAKNKIRDGAYIYNENANNINIKEKFDCIAILDVLYHEKITSVDNVLYHCHQLLNEKGHILIADGAFQFLEGEHSKRVGSKRRFTKPNLELMLSNAGFQIIQSSYFGFMTFFLLFIKRNILEKIIPSQQESINEFKYQNGIIGKIFQILVGWEPWFIRFFSLPFGASIVILAQKNIAIPDSKTCTLSSQET